KEILVVPLLDIVKEDCLIWREQNGMYTVRTGYKLLMQEKGEWGGRGGQENVSQQKSGFANIMFNVRPFVNYARKKQRTIGTFSSVVK
ncbi:hypothetical protein A2U01_0003915, partial [Trifolium medium]|nr:hypothetical protein [Trifolium medium]